MGRVVASVLLVLLIILLFPSVVGAVQSSVELQYYGGVWGFNSTSIIISYNDTTVLVYTVVDGSAVSYGRIDRVGEHVFLEDGAVNGYVVSTELFFMPSYPKVKITNRINGTGRLSFTYAFRVVNGSVEILNNTTVKVKSIYISLADLELANASYRIINSGGWVNVSLIIDVDGYTVIDPSIGYTSGWYIGEGYIGYSDNTVERININWTYEAYSDSNTTFTTSIGLPGNQGFAEFSVGSPGVAKIIIPSGNGNHRLMYLRFIEDGEELNYWGYVDEKGNLILYINATHAGTIHIYDIDYYDSSHYTSDIFKIFYNKGYIDELYNGTYDGGHNEESQITVYHQPVGMDVYDAGGSYGTYAAIYFFLPRNVTLTPDDVVEWDLNVQNAYLNRWDLSLYGYNDSYRFRIGVTSNAVPTAYIVPKHGEGTAGFSLGSSMSGVARIGNVDDPDVKDVVKHEFCLVALGTLAYNGHSTATLYRLLVYTPAENVSPVEYLAKPVNLTLVSPLGLDVEQLSPQLDYNIIQLNETSQEIVIGINDTIQRVNITLKGFNSVVSLDVPGYVPRGGLVRVSAKLMDPMYRSITYDVYLKVFIDENTSYLSKIIHPDSNGIVLTSFTAPDTDKILYVQIEAPRPYPGVRYGIVKVTGLDVQAPTYVLGKKGEPLSYQVNITYTIDGARPDGILFINGLEYAVGNGTAIIPVDTTQSGLWYHHIAYFENNEGSQWSISRDITVEITGVNIDVSRIPVKDKYIIGENVTIAIQLYYDNMIYPSLPIRIEVYKNGTLMKTINKTASRLEIPVTLAANTTLKITVREKDGSTKSFTYTILADPPIEENKIIQIKPGTWRWNTILIGASILIILLLLIGLASTGKHLR